MTENVDATWQRSAVLLLYPDLLKLFMLQSPIAKPNQVGTASAYEQLNQQLAY